MGHDSDSEEFASADESPPSKAKASAVKSTKPEKEQSDPSQNLGWEDDWPDFDDDKPEPVKSMDISKSIPQNEPKSDAEGWDDFDNWDDKQADENPIINSKIQTESEHTEKEFKDLADKLSSLGDNANQMNSNSGWGGWGNWGVSNILSGVSQITTHVSQGFASVSQAIESGIGVPEPEELAREKINMENEFRKRNEQIAGGVKKSPSDLDKNKSIPNAESPAKPVVPLDDEAERIFKLGKLVSSVTKLVENTGSAVVTGGLDTLEEIGKRTMRVLQGEEDGKMRLFIKETREKMDQSSPVNTDERVIKKQTPQFETLFDDFEGLVHLEALEMLSKQCGMRIESLLSTHEGQELIELKETLDQVKDICELPDPEDEDDKNEDMSIESFKTKLLEAHKDMGVQLQLDSIVSCWKDVIDEINEDINEENSDNIIKMAESIMEKAITNLARSSALSVQLLHRATALLSVRERRSTADEADGLTQLTVVLSSHIGDIAAQYSQKLNQLGKNCTEPAKINEFITTIFLEAEKGSTYIHDAFTLTIPILQVGAT